ncbi:hypothetical protein [Clostridium sp. DJ247]|uniref:hypothetical protein n=1 Tax=Clostridium sp. DJ247 TaxID=2726188 RepID=UPI001628C18F|nr:hypothetical protein [Clostridium sp. DJ247]MBC2581127.1 hypothetical protein [Clostridium sp. DJ247]
MIGFIFKIIVYPIILLISDYLFKDIYYSYTYETFFVGVLLAITIYLVELVLFRPGTLLITTAADFLSIFTVIYLSQFMFPGVTVNLIGCSIASTLLATIQFLQHIFLIYNYKTKKLE